MFILKQIRYPALFIISLLLLSACATSYAPPGWLPDKEDIPKTTTGGWITVITGETEYDSEAVRMQYSGEFIGLDKKNVYLLYDSLHIIPREKIIRSTIELDHKNTGPYSQWVMFGTLSTFTNGWAAAATFPLWLIAGIPVVSTESTRDNYTADLPDEVYWASTSIYARFPQGLNGINLKDIKPLFPLVYEQNEHDE